MKHLLSLQRLEFAIHYISFCFLTHSHFQQACFCQQCGKSRKRGQTWVKIQCELLNSCVNLGKSFYLYKPITSSVTWVHSTYLLSYLKELQQPEESRHLASTTKDHCTYLHLRKAQGLKPEMNAFGGAYVLHLVQQHNICSKRLWLLSLVLDSGFYPQSSNE